MTGKRMAQLRWGGLAALGLVIVLYAAGVLRSGGEAPETAPAGGTPPARTTTAVRERVPVIEEAVGTVRSRHDVTIAAQVIARVLSVGAKVGDRVSAGQVLIVLDDGDFAARHARAKAQYERVKGFVARQAATAEQLEAATAEYVQAKTALEHTRIAAPIDGVVAERHVEPGDLASPGTPLLQLLDPAALRLEAQVREGLIAHVAPGTMLDVALSTVGTTAKGTVAEVLPSADPRSRTFEVRVNFDAAPGVYPGMFGRLRFPTGDREVVHVPPAAIERIGQLETVLVERDGVWGRRLVTTGALLPDGSLEVLSGLRGGETVGLPGSS